MAERDNRRLVPYGQVPIGFEAVYTGERSPEQIAPQGWPISRFTDAGGAVIEQWPVWTWRSDPTRWDEDIRCINRLQERLGPLDEDTRRIRAHIGSLVLCEPGLPVTIDELLAAIGRGRFLETPYNDGCWCGALEYEVRPTQHGQGEAMSVIEQLVLGYLAGKTAGEQAERFPEAAGLVRRMAAWLPSRPELSETQALLLERMLLPFVMFTGRSDDYAAIDRECFGAEGRGAELDARIAALAGLPPIHATYKPEFHAALAGIEDPRQSELYRICGALAHSLHGLSDCHHSALRWVERWIHDIGTLTVGIPERNAGTERRRLAEMLFGYTLGVDRWLSGRSMQFVLLDLAYADLGCDPRDEIMRVYVYLGPERTPPKIWLAACLWRNLAGAGNPAGRVIQAELNSRAQQAGVSTREWMDGQLAMGG